MYRLAVVAASIGALVACGTSPTAEDCAALCATAGSAGTPTAPGSSGPKLTAFEAEILGPLVEDMRQGVRPFNAEGIGICKGTKDCEEYLGADVGELPPGNFMVMANLRVPNAGAPGTWTIKFDTECETTRVSGGTTTTSSSTSSKVYDVRYTGEEKGYNLRPLRTIESPAVGARSCTYVITAPHPDGDKVYTGSWSTPDKG